MFTNLNINLAKISLIKTLYTTWNVTFNRGFQYFR